MAAPPKDHYATLQLPAHATDDEVKAAYRRLAKLYHPDLRPGDAAAEETFKAVSEAYSVLADARERRAYDAQRAYGGGGDGHHYGPMGAYRGSTRGRSSAERERAYAETAYDADSASYQELLMRRAREARAARAQYVRTGPDPDLESEQPPGGQWRRREELAWALSDRWAGSEPAPCACCVAGASMADGAARV